MSDQKAMNRLTWAGLRKEGFIPGSDLTVETFSFAPSEAQACTLRDDLQERGWQTRLSTTKPDGDLILTREWIVVATRRFPGAQLTHLDEMVDELGRLAAAHGADFDGWGAEVP